MNRKVLAVAGLLLLAGIWLLLPDGTREGREYIQSQQEKDPAQLAATLLSRREAEVQEEMTQGTLDVSAMIPDYAILGSTRAQSLMEAGLSAPERTFTTLGTTVLEAQSHLGEVKNLKPAYLIFIYDLADIQSNLNGVDGGYGKLYETAVRQVLEADPEAEVYISPILPVSSEALAAHPEYEQIPQYNQELEAMCARTGWHYLDCSVLEIQEDSYAQDGEQFASYWLWNWYAAMAENIWRAGL